MQEFDWYISQNLLREVLYGFNEFHVCRHRFPLPKWIFGMVQGKGAAMPSEKWRV